MSGVTVSEAGPVAGLIQIAIPAKKPETCAAFYQDILELPKLFETGGMSFFDAGGIRLMVGPAGNLLPGAGAPIYFGTDDLRTSQRILSEKDVEFHPEPLIADPSQTPPLAIWFFLDPEGNTLALMGPLRA
ncbi:VOC family protein [uncultured Maricaulis sp.]|uniref:VOC family protein n=1 Tax=uncultured Maricaulis sp. TaxID=174710 RepID=UPI0030DA1D7E|tara:strand:- start:8257 stop:8649 length:393 start_codon:yes stop_codon:yes gene_type:complete